MASSTTCHTLAASWIACVVTSLRLATSAKRYETLSAAVSSSKSAWIAWEKSFSSSSVAVGSRMMVLRHVGRGGHWHVELGIVAMRAGSSNPILRRLVCVSTRGEIFPNTM